MLSAVYTHKFSVLRNLANLLKDAPRADTVSSGHTFFLGEVEVARLYNYQSGPSRIEVDGENFLLKRQKRVIVFAQQYTLARADHLVATARETKLFFLSKTDISYNVKRRSRELRLKDNIWNLRGRQYLLFDGEDRVGVIEHHSDFGAKIDLPPEIPLAVQVFIYKLAFIMWQRGIH